MTQVPAACTTLYPWSNSPTSAAHERHLSIQHSAVQIQDVSQGVNLRGVMNVVECRSSLQLQSGNSVQSKIRVNEAQGVSMRNAAVLQIELML